VARPSWRCAACGAPISWRLSGGRGADRPDRGRALARTRAVRFAIAAVFSLMMIVLFFTDYDHQLLPDL
jgi:hypothetical protein